MRVTFAMLHREASAGLEQASRRLTEFQRQVSTGKRIGRPSDDPSGAATAIVERSSIATTEQYSRAANSVDSRLTVADTVLSDLVSKLTAAQSEVMAAQGSTKTATQREAAAQALLGLREAVLEDLNASFHGTYLFGGAAGTVQPYQKNSDGSIAAYAGSTQEVAIDVDGSRSIAVAFNGQALAQGSDATDVFAVFDDAIAAARAGDDAALTTSLSAFERAFGRAVEAQSRVGASMRAVEEQKDRLTDIRIASETRLSALEDANLAEAITGMSQADAAYRAALGAARAATSVSLMDYLK